jgi:exosome complex component RRP42
MKIPNVNKKKIIELLKEGKRWDNRGLLDYREIKIEADVSINAEGSSRVKIGNTEVIVGVKMGVQEPYPDHKDEGTMMISMEFSPMCGDRYESGPPKIESIEFARVVDRGIRESQFIDWKKLCIEEDKKVWSISIDIYCINDDGNVLDASAIGAVAALKVSRFPKYDKKEEKIIFGELTDEPLPLTENMPFTMTFHKVGGEFIVDPNRNEEDSSESRITLALSYNKKDKMINAMQKGGVSTISVEELDAIVLKSEKIYESIFPLIEKQIESLMKK